MAINSGNPVLKKVETEVNGEYYEEFEEKHATFGGVLLKTGLLFLVTLVSGGLFVYLSLISSTMMQLMYVLSVIAPIAALVCSIVGSFNVKAAPVTSILFSIFMGIFLGLMVGIFEAMVPGIFVAAVVTLLIVFGVTLFFYSIKAFKNKSRFYKTISIVGVSLIFVILFTSIISFFIDYSAYLWIMVIIEGVLIIYGSMMLVMDFDRATVLAQANAPKKYEWQVSMGMLISLIWVFVYIIRFLLSLVLLIGRRRN